MYFLAVEIAASKQLSKVNPDLLDRLERDTESRVLTAGGEPMSRRGGIAVYRFPYAGSHELGALVETVWQLTEIYAAQEQELFGYALCMEHIVRSDEISARDQLELFLRRIPPEGGLWIGRNASSMLMPFLKLERRLDLWKAIGKVTDSRVLPSIDEFIDRTTVLDSVVSEIQRGCAVLGSQSDEDTLSVALIYGAEGSGVGFVARRAAAAISGLPDVPTVFPPPDSVEPETVFAALAEHEHRYSVEHYLDEDEAWLWKRVQYALSGAWSGSPGQLQPDSYTGELAKALRLFLDSYVRRMRERSFPALIVIEQIDELPETVAELIVEACSGFRSGGPVVLVATSTRPYVPFSFRDLPYAKVGVRSLSIPAVSEVLGSLPPQIHQDAVERVHSLSRGRLMHLYHYMWLVERTERVPAINEDDAPDQLVELLVESLSEPERDALYIGGLAGGRLGVGELTDILVAVGHSHTAVGELWRSLSSSGLIRDSHFVYPSYTSMMSRLSQRLGSRADELKDRAANAVYRRFRLGNLELSPDRYILVSGSRDPEVSLEALIHFSEQLVRRGESKLLEKLLDGTLTTGSASDREDTRTDMQVHMSVIRLAQALRSNDASNAARYYESLDQQSVERASAAVRARVTLEQARFHLAVNNREETERRIRRCVLQYQDLTGVSTVGESHIEFGLAQLAAGRVVEAREYFHMVRSEPGYDFDALNRIRSRALEGVSAFLYGNYTLAFEMADSAANDARTAAVRDWELFARFLQGRVYHELGRYESATMIFETGRRVAREAAHDEAEAVMTKWLARAISGRGDTSGAISVLEPYQPDAEAALFAAEAYELSGLLDKAVAVLEQREQRSPHRIRPILSVRWLNGFDGVEALSGIVDSRDIVDRLCRAFHGYLTARQGNIDTAVSELRACSREQRHVSLDPNAPLVLYWYAMSLPKERDSRYDDPATELGKSVNLIQQRVARTDDAHEKNDYRTRNRWYRRLFESARQYNLA
ncbi:MAG: tetratricopeptide repeat protein [Spirochaetales bacterium]